MDTEKLSVKIRIKWVLWALTSAVVVLVVVGVAGRWLAYYRGHDWMSGFAPKLNLDNEGSFPAYFSSMLLLLSSALLVTIALEAQRTARPFKLRWWILAAVFTLMSIDEIVSIHELTIGPLRKSFNLSGVLYFAWVIPGAVFVLLITAIYIPFLLHLPMHTRLRIGIAGSVYVGGALGMELVGGYHAYHYGEHNFAYSMISAVEETMEMAGVVLFIGALFSIMKGRMQSIEFRMIG